MKNFMNAVKVAAPKNNYFDLSYDEKTSMKMGYLYPSAPIECMPGDFFRLSAQSLSRFAPLVAPVMHRFDVRHEYYFVPFRLLWENWAKYITQTEVAGSLPAHPVLTMYNGAPTYTILADHFGLPTPLVGGDSVGVSAMAFAAYQFIYNEYYRDQNLISEVPYQLVDGNNNPYAANLCTLRKRAWEKDYFTSALPFAQKGDPVMIPIGSQVVIRRPDAGSLPGDQMVDYTTGLPVTGGGNVTVDGSGNFQAGTPPVAAAYDPNGSLITEDAGEATSINDLRLAYALQRVKEKLARGGSRLTEFLRTVFRVKPEDARLDRPEYIGGVKTPVVISEVLNTAGIEGGLPQGNMAGHGVGVADGYQNTYAVKEHGVIICMTSVIPRTAYQQGVNRTWLKIEDPTDYALPDLAHIGEQEVKVKEIYAYTVNGEDTFGYQARYGEYKTMPSIVTGDFRTTLKHWHDGRIFTSEPALNQAFVECTPSTRIFAVEDGVDEIYMQIYHKIGVTRNLPKFGTPTY